MAGRRRRLSNSTVATVDDTTIRARKETSILRPTLPHEQENEWPTFDLVDAVVYRMDGKALGNPLLVDTQGPFIIRGQLEVHKKELEARLVKPSVKSAFIEITDSNRYAIGYPPSEGLLWVAGRAGWYKIHPAPKYKTMYAEILEAITLYYEIMNVYEEYDDIQKKQKGKKGRKGKPVSPTIDELFFQYALAVGDGILRHEVEELCDKWAEFFISHFNKEVEYTWAGTEFHKWLHDRHPDVPQKLALAATSIPRPQSSPSPTPEVENSKTRRAGRRTAAADTSRNSSSSEDVAMTDAPTAGKGKGSAAKKELSEPPLSRPIRQSDSDASSVLRDLVEILEDILETSKNHKKVDERSIRAKMYFKCKVTTYDRPIQITKYYSKQLLEHLGPHWKPTPFYQWLKTVSKQKPDDLDQATIDSFPSNIALRDKKDRGTPVIRTPVSHPTSMYNGESDDESDIGPEIRQGKRPPIGRPSGKMSALRPQKRPTAFETDEYESPTGSRRSKQPVKRVTIEIDDSEDSEDLISEDTDESAILEKTPVRLILHAEAIPSMSPSGPNGTWTCDQGGCNYIVRSADEEEGKQLIEAHFRDHESEMQRVNLAVEEGTRGHNPIDHLIQKIQAMRAKRPGDELPDSAGPAPIKRRLLA